MNNKSVLKRRVKIIKRTFINKKMVKIIQRNVLKVEKNNINKIVIKSSTKISREDKVHREKYQKQVAYVNNRRSVQYQD